MKGNGNHRGASAAVVAASMFAAVAGEGYSGLGTTNTTRLV